MKATIAVPCLFSAIMLISAISKEGCQAPHATSICASEDILRNTYYYNNNTGKCEEEFGCGGGKINFETFEECKKKCPYGEYALAA
uniref:Putative salivary kunitz domain protein n=1 Tax=Ixodes ricinus TaxID=34613 RepID=A0A0K8RG14_IXORI